MFKKLLLGLGVTSLLAFAGLTTMNTVHAEDFDNSGYGINNTNTNEFNALGGGTDQGGSLIDTIKSFINWMLGLLSLIALVVLLFGGFKMVTAAGDETKYKDGFKILQQAAVGLAVIGLSWFIVSIIFWVIGGSTGLSGSGGAG